MPRSRRWRPPLRPSRAARHARATGAYKRAAVKRAEGQIEIRLPERRRQPESVVAHLGPTNSGKTHDALAFLAEQGRGVYAGPLRMLAQESHRRLAALLGEEQVGLITGEERINEHAPVLCCTVEMAPGNGEVLVLDEVQWADDEERGAAWTELLLAGDYRHIRLLGALDALPLVRRAFPDAELRVHERKLPLEFVGSRQLRALTPGSVVVAFSRKAVLALAGDVNRLRPARVAPGGDRPLPRGRRRGLCRDRRARPRRQPAVRDPPLRRDHEVRRGRAAESAAVGARADRRPRRPLRARAPRPAPRGASRVPDRRRGADRPAAGRSGSRRRPRPRCGARRMASRRDAREGARELAGRRVAPASPGSTRGRPAAPSRARAEP